MFNTEDNNLVRAKNFE